jgi:hypothetical protein
MNKSFSIIRMRATASPENAALANAQVTDIDDVWRGGTGSWSTPAKWTHGVPNNGTPAGTIYNVFIDEGNAALSSVTLNTIATINNLSIDSGDKLTISDSRSRGRAN